MTEILKIPNAIVLETQIEINKERWAELKEQGYQDIQIIYMFESALRNSINNIEFDVQTKGLINASVDFSSKTMKLL